MFDDLNNYLMKNRLLSFILFLGYYTTYSQVSIGKLMLNAAAQLEVVTTNKAILIPRVNLTGSTDVATFINGNVNSLLVFNTANILTVGTYGRALLNSSKLNAVSMISNTSLNNDLSTTVNGVPINQLRNIDLNPTF